MLLSFLPLCPSMPLPSRKQSARHRQQSLHYSLMRKKHMYWGTLNILDTLRKTFFTWTEFFLGDMFFY